MSAISDRDKKIIYVMLIAMIICLPYFFFIKNKKLEVEAARVEVQSLNERYAYLQELDANRDTYIKETKKMNEDRDKIIASFPADVEQANYTMFLLNTEYSSLTVDADGNKYWEHPLLFDSVKYGINEYIPISNEEADTGFTGIKYSSLVTYRTYYDGVKYVLKYLMDYKDPMTYSGFSIEFDDETGTCTGEIKLDQYAIEGPDRELAPVKIAPTVHKGNEEVGVFGPLKYVNLDENAIAEDKPADDDAEEAEEE